MPPLPPPPRDPDHWLYRFTPLEWIYASLAELARAEKALGIGDRRAAFAQCRRAAGMAINGMMALSDTPDEGYGRSYMDHLVTFQNAENVPEEVRQAAQVLVTTPLPGGTVVMLHTERSDRRVVEATRTVMAHAYTTVLHGEPDGEPL